METEAAGELAGREGFAPKMFEVKFGLGGEGSYEPLVIQTDSGDVHISGVIDRIDMGNTSTDINIVDYKSGSSAIPARFASDGQNLQLPLYAMAVERTVCPGSHVYKGYYLSVNASDVIGFLEFHSSKNADLFKLCEGYVRDVVNGVRGGDFCVRPIEPAVCLICNHQKLCRITELSTVSEEAGES